MPHTAWHDIPKTGFAAQDEEHDALKQRLEALLAAVNSKRPSSSEIIATLSTALDEFVAHFEHEEALKRACHHPQLELHVQAHALFLADIQRNLFDVMSHGIRHRTRHWIAGRLVQWFRRHIYAYDMGLGLDLAAMGQAPVVRPPKPTTQHLEKLPNTRGHLSPETRSSTSREVSLLGPRHPATPMVRSEFSADGTARSRPTLCNS